MQYFAYGSNLLTRRLRDPARAPSAVALGVASAPGFVMRFHKIGTDGSGKCTLIPTGDDADAVYGVLYEFADSDLAGLDREEGVHLGGYARHSLRLRLPNGDTAEAMTYIAGEPYIDSACLPFDWYRDLVVAGAREHRLPTAYIRELEQTPAVSDPDAARAASARRLVEKPFPTPPVAR
ncbi:MAG: gamma-glutamylcyclotransferase [Acidobacteria bacterium]|nr:gamma-glutamylcyclotransferase [Acidobacteriota bacterium]MYA47204.1 gamma-glutamylcyclotransferase [Acidobacteriota bacterium]MYB32945.1 gamma-glutamylcyclotransferase [Acidobacteriota bacterium]MYH23387.1 gamma-glutamylcyclotransferase [Acidobacteriota bacterium]MYI39361.1 gamma-glutamylcyclotransferase [Acidobacteriota bacterium]